MATSEEITKQLVMNAVIAQDALHAFGNEALYFAGMQEIEIGGRPELNFMIRSKTFKWGLYVWIRDSSTPDDIAKAVECGCREYVNIRGAVTLEVNAYRTYVSCGRVCIN